MYYLHLMILLKLGDYPGVAQVWIIHLKMSKVCVEFKHFSKADVQLLGPIAFDVLYTPICMILYFCTKLYSNELRMP